MKPALRALVACLVTGALCTRGAVAADAAGRVPLTVTESSGVARAAFPVTTGLPFAPGQLRAGDGLQLLDDRGREVDLQASVSAWHADGSVRCVLLDFRTSVPARGSRRFTLQYGPLVRRRPARGGIVATEQPKAGTVTIHTGPARFTLSRKRLLAAVKLDLDGDGKPETEALDASRSQRWAVEDKYIGNGPLQLWRVQLEEAGSQRAVVLAEGEYACEKRRVHTKLRLHFYAGKAAVRVSQFINNWGGWMAPAGRGPHLVLPLSDRLEKIATAGGVAAIGRPAARHAGKKKGFWAGASGRLIGLTVSTPDCRIDPFHAEAEFTPAGKITLSLGRPGDRLRFGSALEFALFFHKPGAYATADAAGWATAYDRLYAVAPAKWYCDSKLLGDLLPLDQVATFLPNYAAHTRKVIQRGNVGGFYYNNVHCAAMLFAMSGDPKWLAKVYGSGQPVNYWAMRAGGPIKGAISRASGSVRHIYTRGCIEPFLFTGDRQMREFGLWIADGVIDKRPGFEGQACGVTERNFGFSLVHLTSAYLATRDPRYLAVARDLVADAAKWQAPTGGGFLRPLRLSDTGECPDGAVGGSPWMTGSVALDALIEYHQITADPTAAGIIRGLGRWLARQAWLPAHGKNIPTFAYLTHRSPFDRAGFLPARFGATRDITWMCVGGMPYAAWLSGEKDVIEVAHRGLEENKPGGAAGKWMGQSYRVSPHFPYHFKMALEKWGGKWHKRLGDPCDPAAGKDLGRQ